MTGEPGLSGARESEVASPVLIGAPAAIEETSAEAVLRWARAAFADQRLALVSAFGPGSVVLIHLLQDIAPRLPVLFVDTLHHFPETLEHVEQIHTRYGLNLWVVRPRLSRAEIEARYGPRLWERDLELYQQLTKVEPFHRATKDLAGWITGRRRDQSTTRSDLPVLERGERTRINPLAGWTRAQVWRFVLKHDLPYNPLHDRGYQSIGDEPLTTPVAPGEHERAGRWRDAERLECGIHSLSYPNHHL